jgi:Rrf2 family protein
MLELAASYGEPQPVSIKAIADAHPPVSARFLVQILLQLKTAGLVASVRGASGGYQLARAPDTITLAQIINAIDERTVTPRFALSALNPTPPVEVLLGVWRAAQGVWQEAQAKQQKMLEALSLAELLRRTQEDHALVYQI